MIQESNASRRIKHVKVDDLNIYGVDFAVGKQIVLTRFRTAGLYFYSSLIQEKQPRSHQTKYRV